MKHILFVTGGRAEFGLLKPLIERVFREQQYKVTVVATGSHLSEVHGSTIAEVEKSVSGNLDSFALPLEDDSAQGNLIAMSEALKKFGESFIKHQPDLIFVLGDRYEVFAAAQAALMLNLPLAHIHGGEVTEGAFDDAIRHSISKIAALHFVAHKEFKHRLIQMGEQPKSVHVSGALGIDNIVNLERLSLEDLESSLDGFPLNKKTALVTFHSVTKKNDGGLSDCREMLEALKNLNYNYLITFPNADFGGLEIIKLLKDFQQDMGAERVHLVTSLGRLRYLSALKYVGLVIGNSSSGIIEVPSFKIPTVNILPRQQGRLACESIFHVEPSAKAIKEVINECLKEETQILISNTENPYGDGHAAEKITGVLNKLDWNKLKNNKKFYNIREIEYE